MVKIRLLYDKSYDNFFVLAELTYKGEKYTLRLLVDTGATVTSLLDRDAIRIFGPDIEKFEKATRKLIGIGGYAETYVAKNISLELVDAENPNVRVKFNLSKIYVVTHLKKFRGEEWKRLTQLPSLLGRDVLKRAKLLIDSRANPPIAELEFDAKEYTI